MTIFVADQPALAKPSSGTWLLPLAATLLATALSFLATGYVPISSNNIYHLPILFGAFDLSQFAADPFVQSLRHFSSGFWMLFAGSSSWIEPKVLLAISLVATHFLFLGASVHFAWASGYRDPWLLSAFVVILSLASLSTGEAAGGGALMIEGFTHSELANASLLMALSFALCRQYGLMVAMACITFFLNAFMAVWALGPLLMVLRHHFATGQTTWRMAARSALPGLPAIVLILPVATNILGNHEALTATSFSYPEFLWSFYPRHFFIGSLDMQQLAEVAGLTTVLLLTIRHHGGRSSSLIPVVAGAFAVLVIGTIAPLLTDSRTILNLHLIRSFVVVHWLAVISLSLFALSLIRRGTRPHEPALGLVLIGLLLLPRPFWVACIPLLIVHRFAPQLFLMPPARLVRTGSLLFLTACIAAVPMRSYRKLDYTLDRTAATARWEAIGQWARRNTAPDSIFLVAPDKGTGESALGFSYTSERQIWSSSKYGAAVMWSPSYIDTWNARQKTSEGLSDLPSMLAYAARHDIAYVAAPCEGGLPAVHTHQGICIHAATGAATGSAK